MIASQRLLEPRTSRCRSAVALMAMTLLSWCLCGSAAATKRAERLGVPVRWQASKTLLQIHEPPPESGINGQELLDATRRAISAWRASCADFEISVRLVHSAPKVQPDGRNVLVVRARRWCPDLEQVGASCHDQRLHAVTQLRKQPPATRGSDARIAEADIELNAVHFDWRSSPDPRGRTAEDRLRAVLVHELGHFLGLAHPCADGVRHGESCAGKSHLAMYPDPLAPGRSLVLKPTEEELAAVCSMYPSSRRFQPGHALLWVLLGGAGALGVVWALRPWAARKRAADKAGDG